MEAVQEINAYVSQAKYNAAVSMASEALKANIFIGNVINQKQAGEVSL